MAFWVSCSPFQVRCCDRDMQGRRVRSRACPASERRSESCGFAFNYQHTPLAKFSSSWCAGFSLLGRLARLIAATGLPRFIGSILLAPLSFLGLIPNRVPRLNGAAAVQRFEEAFEAEHGTTHPPFFRGGCSAALSRSKRDARFALVYLHAPDHPDAKAFEARVLSSALFSAFVEENFIFWVGDISQPEGAPPSNVNAKIYTCLLHGYA